MTSLNIGRIEPGKRMQADGKCPSCGAGKDKRIDAGGFGPSALTICGRCAYEFKEES